MREVRGRTVIAHDGSEYEVDTIILGTGFEVLARRRSPSGSTAARRRSLADVWRGGLRHYRAVEVAGFPNYFRLAGAGCGLGHGIAGLQIESQTAYLLDALRTMAAHGARQRRGHRAGQDEYMRFAAADAGRTVWASAAARAGTRISNGQTAAMWPRSMWSYRRLMRSFEPADHHLRHAAPVAPPLAVAARTPRRQKDAACVASPG